MVGVPPDSRCLPLDMGPGYPTPYPWTWDLDIHPSSLLLTSGDHYWRPVQTCSIEDLPLPTSTDT